ncbi:hypothetical protein ASD65_11270 [Microbacterium sp. Root61]|uniref:hypothetical protein n=1 Tax=Microbacterium sp. Root61 TaxID=1736570 RepID=UPI0006F6CD15|nr:hypothetical protein [Microbacterium sp. Root61]KRA24944.1 hypothetical protein ASD65_11270 [Microbacterium sp. Root61]
MTQPQGALLVGSVNYDDAETTFRTAADLLGGHLKRIPDGEVGDRFHWLIFQADILGQADGLERVGDEPVYIRHLDARGSRIADGVDAASIVLPPLGYAAAAKESYALFTRLRAEGAIPAGVRFQVSLPTPVAVVSVFFQGDDRAAIEPVYRAALYAELAEILDAIPHEDLAIQWDVAVEFGIIEAAAYESEFGSQFGAWWEDVWAGIIERALDQAAQVPADVEVGFHLCYGDANEQHFIEPTDTANLVRFANALFAAAPRPITWLHLPVPIERDDEAYYAPLAELALPEKTELYLGLVHREDGAEGAARRSASASKFVPAFGVGTECGIGRAPEGTTEGILRTHAEAARAW